MLINLKDIVILQELFIDIFTEEDNDFVDRRITTPKYKKVDKILDNITINKNKQLEIWNAIQSGSFDYGDGSYKPICDRLRKLGYTIKSNELLEGVKE